MSLRQIGSLPVNKTPDFIQVVEEHLSGKATDVIDFKKILDEVFMISVERGLTPDEFSLLLRFLAKGSISNVNKMQLLPNLVPCSTAPGPAVTQFLAWFIYNKRKIHRKLAEYMLQWLIGLLDNELVELSVIDTFYFDFYPMLQYEDLMKYACKMLCKLTKPDDVTGSCVYVVSKQLQKEKDNKYLHALLNLFKGYSPRSVSEEITRVDINKVLHTVPQKMDRMLKLAVRRQQQILPHRELGLFASCQTTPNDVQGQHRANSLIPFPNFNMQGIDKMAIIYPNSIKYTLKWFKQVPIPQNVMSLLRDETGFTLLTFGNEDLQMRFSTCLMETLQRALIMQNITASEEDLEFLLSRVYELQLFMQQGLPCVSTILSGYFLTWDGLVHRSHILNLLEWATFDSFKELSVNILRPLYMLFVSCDVTMKKHILLTCTNLIRNMYAAVVGRMRRQLPHPFLKVAPAWSADPLAMLTPLVSWMESLCKVGMCLEPNSSTLLLHSAKFYDTMNLLEFHYQLPMWTLISPGVVSRSLFTFNPVALNMVCRLLLKYHKEFLPQLRLLQPQYYTECQAKISLSSKYIQELINVLWTGQAMSKKEDGFLFKQWTEDTLRQVPFPVDLDSCFDIVHNSNFFSHKVYEMLKNGLNFVQNKQSTLIMIEHYFEDIANFIKYFSPIEMP